MVYIFSIDGNIGSGKSTLVKLLERHKNNFQYDIEFIQEPVDEWVKIVDDKGESILTKFYKDQQKYSFSFQMMAYISRLNNIRNKMKECKDDKKIVIFITERSVLTDKNIFARMLYDENKIEDINYKIYLKWFNEFIDEIPIIGNIYIQTDPKTSFKRINKRNRDGENIPIEYLENCHKYHEEWLNNNENLIINCNDDFESNKDKFSNIQEKIYNFIINKIVSQKTSLAC